MPASRMTQLTDEEREALVWIRACLERAAAVSVMLGLSEDVAARIIRQIEGAP